MNRPASVQAQKIAALKTVHRDLFAPHYLAQPFKEPDMGRGREIWAGFDVFCGVDANEPVEAANRRHEAELLRRISNLNDAGNGMFFREVMVQAKTKLKPHEIEGRKYVHFHVRMPVRRLEVEGDE